MAVAATAALPAYEVLIAPGAVDRRELCAALAVQLKELPLRIEVRLLSITGDPFAEESATPGALRAAVLVLGPAAAGASYALEQLYAQLVERCGQRLLAVFSAEPLLGVDPAAAVSFAAFRARLRERHHTRVLPQGASIEELGRALAGFVCALLCEELGLRHGAELERVFAEPEDASPARLAQLLADPASSAVAEAAAPAELAAPAESAPGERACGLLLAAAAAGEPELDPLREPARARALEQRREGLRAFALGEDAVASAHLRAALQELPLDAPSGYWLARLLLAEGGRGAAAEASRIAQRAARVAASAGRPEDAALAHAAAARAEAELGRPQQAEQQARAAAACAPWLAEPWVELACQCLRRGELEAGERALREAFQRDPRALLRLNRELPPGETPDVYRDWKRGLRAELAAAAATALELERRVARLLGEPSEPIAAADLVRAPQDTAALPLLDLLALARESAERTRVRLSALARQLRASAVELGVLADPQCMGELVPLRFAEHEDDDGGRPPAFSVLNWLYAEGERVACGRPVLRYEVRDRRGREQRTLVAPRSGVLTRIAVASGSPPPGDAPLGVLRALPGVGVELSDRLENSRAEETELRLSAHRSERESGVAGRRAAFWAAAAAALLGLAVATWEGATPAPAQEALRTGLAGLCVAPALYAALQALRELGSARRAQQRLAGLGDQIAQLERELARLWDEFRLLGDRFARAVASFEEGLPAAPLFAAPAADGRAAPRGALLRLRPGEAAPSLALDALLFPPELAAQLPTPAASAGAALYRVTESGPRGARAARWASYFAPGD